MKLYEITEQYKKLMDISDEIPEECLADTLAGINGMIESKAEGIGFVIRNLEGMAGAASDEIERLTKINKSRKKRIAWLKSYVLQAMVATDKKAINCDLFSFHVRKGINKTIITDESLIPQELVRVRLEPDKTAIKKAIMSGKKIDGAEVVEGDKTLLFR